MFRTRLSRSSPAISKSNRFPVVLPLLDLNSVISKPHYSKFFFSTDSPMGPFVGSDDHIVRVVNRNGNAAARHEFPCCWPVLLNINPIGHLHEIGHSYRTVGWSKKNWGSIKSHIHIIDNIIRKVRYLRLIVNGTLCRPMSVCNKARDEQIGRSRDNHSYGHDPIGFHHYIAMYHFHSSRNAQVRWAEVQQW